MTRFDISIINYFEKGIPYDIFIQGFYITNILIIAFLFLIYLMPSFHQQNESFVDFYLNIINRKLSLNNQISESRPNNTIDAVKTNGSLNGSNLFDKLIKLFQVFSFSVVITILSFTMGTIFSNVSDSFMDQNNYFHLGLKKNWASFDTSENLANTDDKIKYFVFNKIFGNESLNKSVIDSVLKSTTKYSMVKNENTKNKNTIRKFIIKELYYTSKH